MTKTTNTIETVIGTRERRSCGEVTVPTYYGAFRRGDKAALRRAGYRRSLLAQASGIRADGAMICWHGEYYSQTAPMDPCRINWLRAHEPRLFA